MVSQQSKLPEVQNKDPFLALINNRVSKKQKNYIFSDHLAQIWCTAPGWVCIQEKYTTLKEAGVGIHILKWISPAALPMFSKFFPNIFIPLWFRKF